MSTRATLGAAIAAAAVLVAACAGDEPPCRAGDYVGCTCNDGAHGYAACRPDIEGYGSCVCDGTTPGLDAGPRDASTDVDAAAGDGDAADAASDAAAGS